MSIPEERYVDITRPGETSGGANSGEVRDLKRRIDQHIGSGGQAHAVATETAAGFMSSDDKAKLDSVQNNATENMPDDYLLARGNHTGVQAIETVNGLREELNELGGAELEALVVQAEDAADRAEAAFSGALAAGNLFPTVSAGLLATAPGDPFIVMGDSDYFSYLYQHLAGGTAQLISRQAGDSMLQRIQAVEDRKWAEFREVWREGEGVISIATVERFTELGFLNSDGTFTSSGAGYRSTPFLAIDGVEEILYRAYAGRSTTPLAFYDANFNFISAAPSSGATTELSLISPEGARFIRMCNNPSAWNGDAYARVFLPDSLSYRIESYRFLPESEIEVSPSSNLASQEYFVEGQYITNTGTVNTADGWNMYRIPVKPDTDYTFGNFVIDTAGYSAFLAEDNTLIQYNGVHGALSLPKTVRSPAVPSYLCIDVSRPANVPEDYAETTVNEGAVLLPYEEPVGTVVSILGNRIAGNVNPSEYARLGFDANFQNVVAASISASVLTMNLPSGATVPAGVEINQAWIDTADGSVKVRLV